MIKGGENIHLESYVRVWRDAVLDCSNAPFSFSSNPLSARTGTIEIGAMTSVRPHACLYTYGGKTTIGKNCTINPYVVIYGHGGVCIGNYVRIATHTVIISANHNFERIDIPIAEQEESRQGIHICDDVWIGCGARILDGVTIGRGSVVAAGAVVTKSIDSMSVVAGIPAKLIKTRTNIEYLDGD